MMEIGKGEDVGFSIPADLKVINRTRYDLILRLEKTSNNKYLLAIEEKIGGKI